MEAVRLHGAPTGAVVDGERYADAGVAVLPVIARATKERSARPTGICCGRRDASLRELPTGLANELIVASSERLLSEAVPVQDTFFASFLTAVVKSLY